MAESSNHSLYVPKGRRLDDGTSAAHAQQVVVRCCGYMPRNTGWNHSRVFSPFWRLYYNFAKGHHVVFEEKILPLTPDQFLLIPADTLFHCASPRNACGHLYLHFDFHPVRLPALRAPVAVRADPVALAMTKRLARLAPRGSLFTVAQLSSALLHWVLAAIPEGEKFLQTPSLAAERVLSLIRQSPGAPLPNSALARAAGVSLRGLARLFAAELQCSPHEYLREIRLREAARRLAEGATIEEVSMDLGFANRAYFTRRFSARFGCPPAAFRKSIVSGVPPPVRKPDSSFPGLPALIAPKGK